MKNISEDNQLNNVSVIKTTMMILVVLYHSLLFYSNDWFTVIVPEDNASYLYEIARYINIFTMPIFVFLSGYLFFFLKKHKNKYCDFQKDFKKKFKRLIIPYIFVSALWVIPITTYFFKFSLDKIIKKYLLATSPSQLWFLIMLFGEFLIFYLFSKKMKYTRIELISFMIIYFILIYFIRIDAFQISNIIYYSIFYYLAGYLVENGNDILNKMKTNKIIIILINILVLAFGVLYINIDLSKIIDKIVLLFIQVLFILCCYIDVIKLPMYILRDKGLYAVFEKYSFGIYLFHQQIIFIILYFINGLFHPVIIVIICFLLAIIMSSILVFIFRKFKTTKFMFGV